MIIRAILTIINVNASQRINGILYYLKKLPLIKGLLKNINYSFIGFKKFLSIMSIIYNIIAGPIGFGLFFFVAIYLPTTSFLSGGDTLSTIMFFIFSFFFLYRLLGSELMEPNRETFILVKQMKMDPKVYSISQTLWKKSRALFSQSLVLALVFKFILNKDPINGLKIGIAVTMFTIFMEAVHLYIFKKTDFILNRFEKTRAGIMIAGLAATYAIIGLTSIPEYLNLFKLLINIYLTLILSLLGIIGFIYLLKYDRYWDILNEENKSWKFKEIQEATKDIKFQEVKLRDKDFDEKSLKENEASEKEGYDYLNYIFFKRHKRVVYKPMIRKALMVVAAFLIIFIVDKFFIEGFGADIANEFIDSYAIFVFIVYTICNATTIMKSLFYNCDRSLLRYGFYKKGDALLKMFFLRLRKILLSNMVPIFVLCIGIFQFIYFNAPERILQTIPMIVSTILLGILFSVHYIFIYYILQPFTTDLKTKNPLYNIINFLVYILAYLLIFLNWSAIKMLPYIVGVSIIYISMAIILVYKKAPKTFRVK